MLCPLLTRKSDPSVRNGVLLYKQLILPMMVTRAARGGPLTSPMSGVHMYCNPGVFALLLVYPGT
jgi:hypothetical protein